MPKDHIGGFQVEVIGGFQVEVEGGVIAVTFSGTTFKVAHRKPRDCADLAASGFSKEADATITQILALLTVAHQLANDKARRRLGWIV